MPEHEPKDVSEVWPPPIEPPLFTVAPKLSWRKWLFDVPSGQASNHEVIEWWEARRWTYNKLVFGYGIPAFVLFMAISWMPGVLPPGEDAVEPMALIVAPVMMPIAVNICYTFGWISELIWRFVSRDKTKRTGRFIMQAGVGFSLFVITLPLLGVLLALLSVMTR